MTDSNGDLVGRVALQLHRTWGQTVGYNSDERESMGEAMQPMARAAIAAVLDDLQNPNEYMIEAFYARWDQGHNPESFNTLLGDSLTAMVDTKRKELGL